MQENQNNNNSDSEGGNNNRPKFNYYWIYAIVAVILIALNFFWISPQSKNIDWNKVEKVVRADEVDKIVIINKEYADIYLKKEALSKHSEELPKPGLGMPNTGPHSSIL